MHRVCRRSFRKRRRVTRKALRQKPVSRRRVRARHRQRRLRPVSRRRSRNWKRGRLRRRQPKQKQMHLRQGIRMHPKRMGHRTAIKKTMVRIKKTAIRSQRVTARTIRIKKTMRMTRTVRKVTFRNRMMRANRWIILMRQPIMLPISLPETVFI